MGNRGFLVAAIAATTFNSLDHSCLAATRTWLGTINSDLTDPRNWNGGTLPVDSDSWYFGTSPNHQVSQYDYSKPFLPYVDTLQLTDSPDGPYSFLGESLLNVGTVNVAGKGHWIAGFRRPASVTIVTTANGTADANLAIGYINMPGDFEVLGSGTVSVAQAEYNGQTIIGDNSTLRVGGKVFNDFFYGGLTLHNDVLLQGPHSRLTGLGGLTIDAGHSVHVNNGIVSPGDPGSSDVEQGSLRIHGDITFGDSSQLQVQVIDASHYDQLQVTGLLDLRGMNDVLSAQTVLSGSQVVAQYQQRLGSFDLINGPPDLSVTYTSVEGAGPGEIIIQLPEPGGIGLILMTSGIACVRRSRSRRAKAVHRGGPGSSRRIIRGGAGTLCPGVRG